MIKFIIPDISKTFGTLTFGSCVEEKHADRRAGSPVTSRVYSLFSDKQRADDLQVEISKPILKKLGFDEEVELVNPVIKARPRRIGDNWYTDYTMIAEDIVLKGDK